MGADATAIGMISNPASGHNRSHFSHIEQRVAACDDIHHVVTHGAADIDAALAEMIAKNVAVLAINGGDGTVSAILGKLLENGHFPRPPRIVILPGGTANMNAGDVGVKGSLKKAVEKFCRSVQARKLDNCAVKQRSLLRVKDHSGAIHHTMFIGGGAIIHGTEYAHREIHSRGLRDDFSLILGTVRTVWGVLRDDPQFNRHVSIEFARNDEPQARFDTLILAISTLERLSFGMRPFWSDEPGNIRITLMEQGCTKFARTFFSIIRGKPSRNAVPSSGYHSHNAGRVHMRLTGNLNLDGEMLPCDGDIEITATEALEFLQL